MTVRWSAEELERIGTAQELRISAKYGRYGETSVAQMVTDAAAATTLRLIPEHGARTERRVTR